MQNLTMGANAPLPGLRFEILIEWPTVAGILDSSTYLTGPSGQVRSDADMIFYNQRSDAAGCVTVSEIEPGIVRLEIDLGRVPSDVDQIVMCVTAAEPDQTMAAFQGASITVVADGSPALGFTPDLGRGSEVAMRLAALYRRNGAWKFRAIGQGYNQGLAKLAKSFGIEVAEDEAPPTRVTEVQPTLGDSTTTRAYVDPVPDTDAPWQVAAPAPQPSRRDDGSIRLSTERPNVSWTGDFGEVSARLEWSSQCGGLQGRPRALAPHLGCFYQLDDGRRGLVQYWDGSGQFDTAPFIHLMHSDQDGLHGEHGEQRLRINGARLSAIAEVTLFAHLGFDAPNWRSASLSLVVSAPGHTPVSVSVEEGPDGSAIVALLSIRHKQGEVELSRLLAFAPGHRELDQHLNWGLQWRTRHD